MLVELSIAKPKLGVMSEFSYNNKDLFIVNIANKLFCADNCCPHEGIKLTLGCIKNNSIKCSLHGFSFDLRDGLGDEDGVDSLTTYRVIEENNKIFIDI